MGLKELDLFVPDEENVFPHWGNLLVSALLQQRPHVPRFGNGVPFVRLRQNHIGDTFLIFPVVVLEGKPAEALDV